MAFKLHPEARDWFKKISGSEPFGTLFDLYHVCLVMGLTAKRHETTAESDEFMDDFIMRYRPYQSLIIGVVIATVLARQGISTSDRAAVAREISRLVSGDSTRGDLTSDGFQEMNAYALGGFNYLRERFDVAPQNRVYFMKRYRDFLQEWENPKSDDTTVTGNGARRADLYMAHPPSSNEESGPFI